MHGIKEEGFVISYILPDTPLGFCEKFRFDHKSFCLWLRGSVRCPRDILRRIVLCCVFDMDRFDHLCSVL